MDREILDTIFNNEETSPKTMLKKFRELQYQLQDYVVKNAVQGPEGPQGEIGPEGPKGDEGLSIYTTNVRLSGSSGSTSISSLNVPEDRTVKVGDLIFSTNALSNGYINRITSIDGDTLSNVNVGIIRGAQGPEGPQGPEGLSIFSTKSLISATISSIPISELDIPTGRTVKVGDLILSTNMMTNGYLNRITSIEGDSVSYEHVGIIRGDDGPQGPEGPKGDEGLSIYATKSLISATISSIPISELDIPTGRTVKVGDLILSTNMMTNGYLNRITSIEGDSVSYEHVGIIRGSEGPQGNEGLSIFTTNQQIKEGSGSIYNFSINIPTNRTLKVGDLILSTHELSNGYFATVSTISGAVVYYDYAGSLRGPEGPEGPQGEKGDKGDPGGVTAYINTPINTLHIEPPNYFYPVRIVVAGTGVIKFRKSEDLNVIIYEHDVFEKVAVFDTITVVKQEGGIKYKLALDGEVVSEEEFDNLAISTEWDKLRVYIF